MKTYFLILLLNFGCGSANSLEVTASAYNSVKEQTDNDPTIAAWGDQLVPGMQVIAVSRDLEKKGLIRGTWVKIEGLTGYWIVLDRMSSRWKNKIDLYMGIDIRAARQWGVQKVRISW